MTKAKVCGSVLGGIAIPFRWSDGSVCILGVWFGPDLLLDRNWSEVQAKVNAQVGIWLSRRLSLKGRAEACATYVFPLIFYRLAVLPLLKARRLALKQSLSRLPWRGVRPMVRRQVCIQRTRNGGLGIPDLENHWLAERLAYLGRSLTGDAVWRQKASRTFPRLKSDPKAEGRRKSLGEALFVRECRVTFLGPVTFHGPRKELYRELAVGSASDPLSEWQGALPLLGLNYKAGLADMADCARCGRGLEETAEHVFYYCGEFARFGITSGSGRLASNPNSSTLVTS